MRRRTKVALIAGGTIAVVAGAAFVRGHFRGRGTKKALPDMLDLRPDDTGHSVRRVARSGGLDTMTSILNQRSVHINAPVQRVFDHVKDPNNFVAADPEPVRLSNLSLTPEGVGSSWETSWRAFGLPLHAVTTRQECIPNQRIVDHASIGITWTYTTEPDPTGTTLSLAFAITTKVALANKFLNRVFSSQGRQLDKMLAHYQEAIQA